MKQPEKILVPINVDNVPHKELQAAIALAKRFRSKMILLHVLPMEAKRDEIGPIVGKHVENEFVKLLESLGDADVEKMIKYGKPFDQIISVAEAEDVNLIMVTGPLEHGDEVHEIDAVTEKLIRRSEKPVWVVKKGSRGVPERILCPVDFSKQSGHALGNAVKIAKTFDCQLFVINIFEPLEVSFPTRLEIDYDKENEYLKEENEEKFEEFLKRFDFSGVKSSKHILSGKTADRIMEFARKKEVDVIFMGAAGKSFLQRMFLGSVTETVIRQLPCSMVITKSEDILDLKLDPQVAQVEKHYAKAKQYESEGAYSKAIEELQMCLHISDLHIPAITALIRVHGSNGDKDIAGSYKQKLEQIIEHLWDDEAKNAVQRN